MHATSVRPTTQLGLLTDGQLLVRFIARGDQDAFAMVVQRHGALVLGVCRRMLRDGHEAEDAFQAVFVILARKAGTITKHTSIASWLYKVSYRVALRLRSIRAKRQAFEHSTDGQSLCRANSPSEWPAHDNPFGEAVLRELRQVLDEEVSHLPEKYRAPIVLCYLQGQSNEEAAAALHCPTGTVKIRLLRARELLRKRLVRRGVALSATFALAEALTETARAALPQPLARAATEAALGGATEAVSELVTGALKRMCATKLKVAALVLLTLSLICLVDQMLTRAVAAPSPVQEKLSPSPVVPTFQSQPLLASREGLIH